jgi:hypothetical protein
MNARPGPEPGRSQRTAAPELPVGEFAGGHRATAGVGGQPPGQSDQVRPQSSGPALGRRRLGRELRLLRCLSLAGLAGLAG